MHAKNVRLSGNSGAVGMPGRKKIWEGSEDFSLLWRGTGWPHSGYVLLELHSVRGGRGGHPPFPTVPTAYFCSVLRDHSWLVSEDHRGAGDGT